MCHPITCHMLTDQQMAVKTQFILYKNIKHLQLHFSALVEHFLRLYTIVLYMLSCMVSPYTVLYGLKMSLTQAETCSCNQGRREVRCLIRQVNNFAPLKKKGYYLNYRASGNLA